MRRQLCGAVLVCLALFAMPQGQLAQQGDNRFVPGEIIVKFRPATTATQRDAIINSRSAGQIRRFTALGLHRLRLRNGQSVEAALAAFRAQPEVALAQPNYIRRAIKTGAFTPIDPNDPFWQFGFQWAPQQIQAPEVWNNYTTGSPTVVIASIDTGVDYLHTDLAANMWHNPGEVPDNGLDDDNNGYVDDEYGIDTVNGDTDPMDDQGHGTQTVGVMAMVGNNGVGGVGVTWNSKVLSCKFVDQTGNGTDADAIECFNYLVTMKQRGVNIRVSNNSWGSAARESAGVGVERRHRRCRSRGDPECLRRRQRRHRQRRPAVRPCVVRVAEHHLGGRVGRCGQSRELQQLRRDVGAHCRPWRLHLHTGSGSTIGFASGTSMAAPMVAGAAALMVANDSTLTVDQLKARLITSVDVLAQWGGVVSSGGRLNVFNAVAFGGNAPPSATLTSPASGASFAAPATIPLQADASDSDGTIAKVDFYANGVLVGTDTTGPGPFTFSWLDVSFGSYSLTAVATDDLGASRASIRRRSP